jgi:NAD(P)H-dependent nitrite reductase small subunit
MSAFVKVAKASDIPAGSGKVVEAGGKQIAIFEAGGKYYAIDNTCTHRGAPLAEGVIQGTEIECPWHRAHFNLETGQATRPPAARSVGVYPVRRQGDDIEIEI